MLNDRNLMKQNSFGDSLKLGRATKPNIQNTPLKNEELGLSIDDTTDFGLSESNFSHSMISNKMGQLRINTSIVNGK